MKFARKVAAFAVTAVALSTVFIGVGAASAATPQAALPPTVGPCDLPTAEVTSEKASAVAETFASQPRGACLDITFTDKCDGTTVVQMSNGAFNDNKFTVLNVELDGKNYKLKGGSDPNTVTVEVGPKVVGLQPHLVFTFTGPDGSIVITKNFGDPWTWEEPKGCVSPSPSASASASPSPSVTAVPTSAPATTTGAPAPQVNDGGDLPVTGASLFGTISTGVGLVLAGIVALVVIARRRRAAGN